VSPPARKSFCCAQETKEETEQQNEQTKSREGRADLSDVTTGPVDIGQTNSILTDPDGRWIAKRQSAINTALE
jgi:hypothetical protein